MGSHCLAWSNFPMMSAKPVLILLWLELVLPVTSVQIKEEEQMEAVLQDLVHVALSRKIKSPFFLFYLTKLYFSELTPAEEPSIRSVHCFPSLVFFAFIFTVFFTVFSLHFPYEYILKWNFLFFNRIVPMWEILDILLLSALQQLKLADTLFKKFPATPVSKP